MATPNQASAKNGDAFSLYLRTGFRVSEDADNIELKYNPWHDPDDGKFTFRNSGRFFGSGNVGTHQRATSNSRGRTASTAPENPQNHSVYTIQKGVSLARISAWRKGLRAKDLAELNGLDQTAPLKIGQRLMLPSQSYLDEGKRARDNFTNLAFYMQTHGGRLPPNVAKTPTVQQQLDSDWHRETRNGYAFDIDIMSRTRQVSGTLQSSPAERRSRSLQANAGKPDRLPKDDGGHYVAPRFNGPREAFNHFAQDSNFNRGAYRVLEDRWAASIKRGQKVDIRITPIYSKTSARPSEIKVRYTVNGAPATRKFSNRKGGR